MVDFLIKEVGADVNTICYGVIPAYCCLPSMHDGEENFSANRLNALKAFMENNADLSHKASTSTRGNAPSELSVIHTACWINNPKLRDEALTLITTHMKEKNLDCNVADKTVGNAIEHLRIMDHDAPSSMAILKNAGVVDSAVSAASGVNVVGDSVERSY